VFETSAGVSRKERKEQKRGDKDEKDKEEEGIRTEGIKYILLFVLFRKP
jgi:hypothetical protein